MDSETSDKDFEIVLALTRAIFLAKEDSIKQMSFAESWLHMVMLLSDNSRYVMCRALMEIISERTTVFDRETMVSLRAACLKKLGDLPEELVATTKKHYIDQEFSE